MTNLLFRDLFLSITLMMDAMISIVWSMGLLIGLGFPIHIMSSMAPVFLMAIATDSMHIFNEFYFRYREVKNKKTAIIETMKAVSRPVRNTALATAAGFAVLLFMHIIPVKVFGGLVAFGTIGLRVLSFSFIPAMFTFVKEDKLEKIARSEDVESDRTSRFLKKLAGFGAHHPKNTVFVGLALFVVAVIGITRTTVNNNLVEWFKKSSDIRVADSAMNKALGGTSMGYVIAIAPQDDYIKNPEAMRYIEGLQRHLEKLPVVGKTASVVDYVKRINQVLHDDNPQYDTVPDSKEAIGQYLFLFSMSAKPSDLDNVVDYPFRRANIWVQLKTWDAKAMKSVIDAVDDYKKAKPTSMEMKPSGIAYFNLVWNHEVLWDMVKGFILALIAVFGILAFDFRSLKWAMVGYAPLLFTILLIYGVVGFIGKDFDMPISVLSCLSVGMAVDFAIHFVSRFRQRLKERGDEESINDALLWTAARPGKGIVRNAVLFAASFKGTDDFFDYVPKKSFLGLVKTSLRYFFSKDCLLARRVMERSMLRGMMLIFVYWGFIILFIGTVIVAVDYDLGLHILKGRFYLVYSFVLDIAGGLALLSLLFYILRRYVFLSREVVSSWDDAVVLVLMFLIVLTGFCVEGTRLARFSPPSMDWSPVGAVFASAFATLTPPMQRLSFCTGSSGYFMPSPLLSSSGIFHFRNSSICSPPRS